MKTDREDRKTPDNKRLEQITFIMDHWDELPERIKGRFEGTITTASDFLTNDTGIKESKKTS